MPSMNSKDYVALSDPNSPKYGISFERAQADKLIRQHLNLTIKTFEYIDTGYHNLIYFIDVNETSERYVLKIAGRYWVSIKIEAEVNALALLAKYTTIPTPKVLAYSSDPNNEFGVEWILMTRVPGENMLSVSEANDLSPNAIKSIIRDLADYVSQMHFAVPQFDQIGGFTPDGDIGPNLSKLGPWSTCEQFIRDRVQAEAAVLDEQDIFGSIRDTVHEVIRQFDELTFPSMDHIPFVFSHGDLAKQNIMISMDDPEAPRITGILDWEWAGSFPCSDEYFSSYVYFLQNQSDEIHAYFLEQLEKRHVLTPKTIEHFSLLHKCYRFINNLAPWELTYFDDPDDPIVMARLEEGVEIVQSLLQDIRNELDACAKSNLK